MRKDASTWTGRLFAAASLAVIFGYVPYHLYTRSGLARTLSLRQELASVRVANDRAAADNERLAREAKALREDDLAVERVARRELGWVRPGEIVFQIEDRGAGGHAQAPLAAGVHGGSSF